MLTVGADRGRCEIVCGSCTLPKPEKHPDFPVGWEEQVKLSPFLLRKGIRLRFSR